MDIVSRLKRFIDTHQIPVTQFADNCRIARPTLSQLLNGRNKKVSDEVISKIHEAYPRLSVLWLMFGEGAMEYPANIEMSEAQIGPVSARGEQQDAGPVVIDPEFDFDSGYGAAEPGKMRRGARDASAPAPPYSAIPFAADDVDDDEKASTAPQRGEKSPAAPGTQQATITFGNSRGGKRVISIVVYYDDNSYESFIPDPSRRSPFMR